MVQVQVDPESGDGLEFVQGPSGMPQSSPRNHRHRHSGCGADRRKDQRSLVSDPAGGMLVDLDSGNHREVHDLPGIQHGLEQPESLIHRKPVDENRHQQGGCLIVRDFTSGKPINKKIQFCLAQRLSVAFLADDLGNLHLFS